MTLHNFSVNTSPDSPEIFYSVLQSNQTDLQQRSSPISIHNYSKDVLLARKMADEVINISGAEISVFARTDNADHDKVWDEDPDPTYWPAKIVKGFFKPEPTQAELKSWGVDTPNRTEITFSHREILEVFGERMLRSGDVLQLPYNAKTNSPKNFRILNVTPAGNFRYIWLYLQCSVETLTADITVRVDNDLPVEGQIQRDTKYWES